jgi:biotin carboxylase
LCRLLNIDTPKTIFVTHDGARSAASELGYPCFLKLSGTVASEGVFQISSEAELDARLGLLPKNMEMQLQTRVEGDFVDITGFSSDGKVLESFAFGCDYVHSRAGTPAYSKRVRDERLTDILCKVAGELRWTGGIDLDLLQRTDGSFVLLEINPRFSGTIVFPLKLGIDFPMYYVNAKLGIAGSPRFAPAHPGAERFVSLFEETSYLRFAGEAGKALPASFRADGKWVDNAFWDDPRYSAEFFQYVRSSLLYAKR